MPRHPPCALKNLTYRNKRCSRPLYSSQATGRTNPTTPTNPQPHQHKTSRTRNGMSVRPIPHPNPQKRPALKKQSTCVARSLRTQQRAQTTPPTTTSVPPRKTGGTNHSDTVKRPTNRCSTLSNHPTSTSPPNSGKWRAGNGVLETESTVSSAP